MSLSSTAYPPRSAAKAPPCYPRLTSRPISREGETDKVLGFYILHPNNVGRCGHIGNASYGVRDGLRGQGIGRLLVEDSLKRGHELGYKIMQFNAVVDCNPALALYKELGFIELGTIPGGFNYKDDHYEDIHLMYHLL